jgi:GMT-like wHTH domain
MHLGNDVMNEPINEFFRPDVAAQIRQTIARLRPAAREEAIIKAMRESIKELGANVANFTYRSQIGTRTSHHLMCVTRHRNGLALFKEISAKQSTSFDSGVPSGEHNPGADPAQRILFSPLTELEEDLKVTYAGKYNLTPEQIYHEHHNGKPYVLKNYRQALLNLEAAGDVEIDPPRAARSPDTLPSTARIAFRRAS